MTLPNSKIRIALPLFMIVNDVDNIAPGHGVSPDYEVRERCKDVPANFDRPLDYVFDLVK
jgi:hypothetical protein